MLSVRNNVDLKPFNTFGMSAQATFFSIITNREDCRSINESLPRTFPVLPLGGGSNILFTKNPEAWVLKNEIQGIELIKENEEHVWLKVGAGMVWHDFVMYCVAQNFAGVENLSLIPGTVGAAPIQNIGAYGAEVKQVIDTVTYWHFDDQQFYTIDNAACRFGYRDSIFKQELKQKIFITEVVFKLSKTPHFNITYGNIKEQLEADGVTQLSLKAVSDAVIHIRKTKLPNPEEIGNAGSFFKNPEVPKSFFDTLKHSYPELPGYVVSESITKIPAAWLIEQSGWKGFREDGFGVHVRQPLVLVNYGNASGDAIFHLSEKIIASVKEKFGIALEREVQII